MNTKRDYQLVKLEYLKRIKERQKEKYFSLESVEKRRKKAIKYKQNQYKRIKENKIGLKNFSDKMKSLHKKDEIFYKEIWNNRKHYCENCKKFLGDNFYDLKGKIIVYRYAHIIPKSVYPYLRHYNANIMLLCLDCHTKYDQSPKEIVEKMSCYNENHIIYLKDLHKKLEKENDKRYYE